MKYSEIKKQQWFELLQLDHNPYDYERFLYNTGLTITDRKSRKRILYFQIHKNSFGHDYSMDFETLNDGFWLEKDLKEIEYKNPPKPVKEVNRIFIEKIFEEWPP